MSHPDHTELEQAILQYLGVQPPSEGREGTLYVKVTDLERVTHPPESSQFRGGLFLSVPFVGADRTKLDQALARVRKGFKRDEIVAVARRLTVFGQTRNRITRRTWLVLDGRPGLGRTDLGGHQRCRGCHRGGF